VEDVGLSRKLKFWKQFIEVLEARMFSTGGILIKNPHQYSSRKCYICGYINVPKECSEREFICVSCGMTCNRDVNASRNNLEGGLSQNAPFFLKQLRKECYGTKDRGAGPALVSSLHKIKNPEGLDEVFGDYTRAMNVILSCEYKLKLSTTALWQRIPLLRKQFSCFKNIHTQSIRAFITRSDIREYFIRGITPGVSLICYPKGSFNADTFKIKFGKINKTFELSSSYIKHSEPEECWLIKDTEGVWWVDIRDKPIITEIKKEGILAGMSMFPYQIVFSDGFVLPSFFKFMQDTEVYDPYQKTYCTLKDKLLFRYMYMNSSINIILDRGYSTIFVESNIYWQELNGGRHFISCLTAEGTEKGIQVIRVPSSTVRGRCHCCNTKTTVFIKQFLKEITDEKKFLYCPVCGIKTNWQKNLVLTILKKGASSLGG
jgi:putative transposase